VCNLIHNHLVRIPTTRDLADIDGLWGLLMQERHENAHLDHILELLVEGQFKHLVVVVILVEDFFFVLSNQVRDCHIRWLVIPTCRMLINCV